MKDLAIPEETISKFLESDFELARKISNHDENAYAELYKRYNRRTYSLCLRMLQNVSDAEDLCQEVWIKVYDKVHLFRGESQFSTWLHRLTVNQVLMFFRHKKLELEDITKDGELPIHMVRGTENPKTMSSLDKIEIDAAISKLADGYREIFTLHDIEGLEHEQIAFLLGCSVGTSKSQLHKARTKLRLLLGKQKESNSYVTPQKDKSKLPQLSYRELLSAAEDAAEDEES